MLISLEKWVHVFLWSYHSIGGNWQETFGEKDETKSLRIFGKPSAINGFGMPLPATI